MRPRMRARRLLAAAMLPVMAMSLAMPVAAADRQAGDYTATKLKPVGRVEGSKSASARLAQTDPELLARNDSARVRVMIKLDYDAVASYTGTVEGFAATSPRATGKPLTGRSNAEKAYLKHVVAKEAAAIKALKAVKGVTVGRALRLVYGGVAASIPANAVERILKIPGVAAVQVDQLEQPLTDASPDFIGADAAYARLGSTANAGQGRIFASIDSGLWPEHPSFADQGNLPAPPVRPGGGARECDFGDNPLTPETDVFACNDKLIGGMPFLDTYNDAIGGEVYPDSARDSNGHGTHTASTAAGNVLDEAMHYGVDRGPLNGVAPGAHVIGYKVCGLEGCYDSDSTLAVEQAILDGAHVINYSISGGVNPYNDPVELAFLDAYAAGIFVAASAGNDGPGASTANHLSPWVTTVAASTQVREFATTLTVTNDEAEEFTSEGASITAGAGPAPVVLSSDAPYSDPLCEEPAPDGLFAGMIVACQRGTNARVEKGYNVLQGDAEGMILYNPSLADTVTDNHWLPTVHLADGTDFLDFMDASTNPIASWPDSGPESGQGDVIANFSSRGPAGNVLKPDITAPGVQILAGHTPTPESILEGPEGEYFQAIAGTSMSAPHIAGSALLVGAVHTGWTPGKIKSALMTTATRDVVKEDLVTPADPFDMGAGRVELSYAIDAALSIEETAANFMSMGASDLTAHNLNIPSLNADVVPGRLTTTRRVQNVSGGRRTFNAFTVDGPESRIAVSPSTFTLDQGRSQLLTITIYADADTDAQQWGSIEFRTQGRPAQHMPVAFVKTQGSVSLTQHCQADELYLNQVTDCQVTATNHSFDDQRVDFHTRLNDRLWMRSAWNATRVDGSYARKLGTTLAGGQAGTPSLSEYGPLGDGYLPLSLFSIPADAIGDEEAINYDVPPFLYNGIEYSTVGVVSNGYLVVGGADGSEDIICCPLPDGTDPSRPNNVLAPFWADLEGTDSPGIFAAILSGGGDSWLVIEFHLEPWGTEDLKIFQTWIGLNGYQDITYNYDPSTVNMDGIDEMLYGAENQVGDGEMVKDELPPYDIAVESSDPVPGQSAYYVVRVKGVKTGYGSVSTTMYASGVPGATVVQDSIQVLAP